MADIPQALVTAAAEALHSHVCVRGCGDSRHLDLVVSDVLAAAFAALPECDEMKPPTWFRHEQRDGWDDCLTALARMGDCICGEINARHCPVHNDQEADHD